MLCLVKRSEEGRGGEIERERTEQCPGMVGGGRGRREGREAPVRKVGGSGTGKKLGTKHDISLTESGHFLPRLFRRVLRLERRRKKFRFSCA